MLKDFEHWQKVCCFITRRCQLRCRGCNVVNYQPAYEMNLTEWKKAFDIFKEYDVGFAVLFGGEPTLREDLPEMVKYLNKIKLPHTIITNSIKMVENEHYYNKILDSEPYGISCSVNKLKEIQNSDDDRKTSYGIKLLKKLNQNYEGDLVANIAVTKENLRDLPEIVRYFSNKGIWSILSFFHTCDVHESTYYWFRGVSANNWNLVLDEEDVPTLREVGTYFANMYDDLLLHNSTAYFKTWGEPESYEHDWKCHSFTCPAVNPDGGLMACIDRPLPKPYAIFDMGTEDENLLRELSENFYQTIDNCSGCFWDHMWETNMYARKGLTEEGKLVFAHKKRSGVGNP